MPTRLSPSPVTPRRVPVPTFDPVTTAYRAGREDAHEEHLSTAYRASRRDTEKERYIFEAASSPPRYSRKGVFCGNAPRYDDGW